MALATLALFALLGGSPVVDEAPRTDFIDEICFYRWTEDRWACDEARLARVAFERVEVSTGPVPVELQVHRHAVGIDGRPVLLPPEERGYEPGHWGPKPLWVCISGLEVRFAEGAEVAWDKARWFVDGRPVPTVARPGASVGATLVQAKEPPCVGPRLLFQSDQELHLDLEIPYRHQGREEALRWRWQAQRRGLSELAAMKAVSPPRRFRGELPEPPEARTIPSFAPVGTCLGGAATALGLLATVGGSVLAGQAPSPASPPEPLLMASAAVAAVPLAAGLAADGTLLAMWIYEGIEHFRYDLAVGTADHLDRSRLAYERRMKELGLPIPGDY